MSGRREFVVGVVGVGAAAVVGCSGGGGNGDAGSCNAVNATIGTNHGHALDVPPGHVSAGAMMTYSTTGTDHVHQVTISAAEFDSLAMGNTVSTRSADTNGHDHAITLRCT